MSNADFNWSDDDSAIVFPTVQGIAVYRNPLGNVVIRQQADPSLDSEDRVIVVPRSNLGALILALQSEQD